MTIKIKSGNKVEELSLKLIENRENFYDEDFDFTKLEVAEFLHEHLGKFGDEIEDINKSLNYALSNKDSEGGFIFVLHDDDEIVGSVVINRTGMAGFIPENILVYIAIHSKLRGKGVGGKLLKQAVEKCDGDVALHVEYDNPAKRLYERSGFKSKYAEMRYKK